MKPVIPENLANKSGHYVPGMISRGMLYISGQLPIDKKITFAVYFALKRSLSSG